MTTKPIFRVIDIPAGAAAEQMQALLNGPVEDGYSLQSITYTWAGIGARAVFKLPAKRVHGQWVHEDRNVRG